MWSLLKSAVSLVVFGVVAYALLGVDVGGRSIASHVIDIWRSPVMQEKVDLVRGEMKKEIEERLAASEQRAPAPDTTAAAPEFDDRDERALEHIVGGK